MFLTVLEQNRISSGGVDDAQNFINATGIVDATQISSIETLVSELKSFGIWGKLIAIYPIVGGTAFTHKFNLKNPLDTNDAFRLSYSGVVNHSSNGMLSNGTTGYVRTFLNPFISLTNGDLSLSFYTRTNSNAGDFSAEITIDSAYNSSNWLTFRVNNKTSGNAYFSAGNDNIGATTSSTLGQGFFIGNEIANNNRLLYRNGFQIATNTTLDNNTLPNNNISFFGSSDNNKSQNECSFASLGSSLTSQEVIDFNTIVNNYQTNLSRNI